MNISEKLPFLVIIIAAGCIIGFRVYLEYKRRRDYFYQLNVFIGEYTQAIMYSRETVLQIVGRFTTPSKLVAKHLQEYVKSKESGCELSLSAGCLKADELTFVKSLLSLLGTSDSATQKSSIAVKREELNRYLADVDSKFKKNGNSSIKLGLLGGLLVSIICL